MPVTIHIPLAEVPGALTPALLRDTIVPQASPVLPLAGAVLPAGQRLFRIAIDDMGTGYSALHVLAELQPDFIKLDKMLVRDLPELGFGRREARLWREMTAASHGIILVTGPTGSGKTTTLYSALKTINTVDVNIMTAEDPVEFNFDGINQVAIKTSIGLTFAAAKLLKLARHRGWLST